MVTTACSGIHVTICLHCFDTCLMYISLRKDIQPLKDSAAAVSKDDYADVTKCLPDKMWRMAIKIVMCVYVSDSICRTTWSRFSVVCKA